MIREIYFKVREKVRESQGSFLLIVGGNQLLCNSHCESTGSPSQGILTFENFCPNPHPHLYLFVSDSPLFPTPGGGNLFILNVRTAPGSEHHCHNSLSGMSERCQNPMEIPGDSQYLVHQRLDGCLYQQLTIEMITETFNMF